MHNNVNYSIGTYSTERCILRPINLNDSLDMFEYYSKDYVVKYLPIKHHKSISDTKRFINSYFIHSYKSGKISHFAIVLKSTNKVIGNVGFNNISKNAKEGEIGICINPEYWGIGLSYELLLSMLRYGFEEIKLEKVTATIYEDNKYSRNTVEKLGFKKTGTFKKSIPFKKSNYIYCYKYKMDKEYYFTKYKIKDWLIWINITMIYG